MPPLSRREATAPAAFAVEHLVRKTLLDLELLRETQRSYIFDPMKKVYFLQELYLKAIY